MRTSERQLIVEEGVEDVRSVKEGRSVVEIEIVAGRVIFRGILNRADCVQRLGKSVVHIENQSSPIIIAESDDERVVIGAVVAIAHEQVEYLQIVVGGQPKHKLPVYIYRVKQARDVVVYEVCSIARCEALG